MTSLAFSSDDQTLAVSSAQGVLTLWQLPSASPASSRGDSVLPPPVAQSTAKASPGHHQQLSRTKLNRSVALVATAFAPHGQMLYAATADGELVSLECSVSMARKATTSLVQSFARTLKTR